MVVLCFCDLLIEPKNKALVKAWSRVSQSHLVTNCWVCSNLYRSRLQMTVTLQQQPCNGAKWSRSTPFRGRGLSFWSLQFSSDVPQNVFRYENTNIYMAASEHSFLIYQWLLTWLLVSNALLEILALLPPQTLKTLSAKKKKSPFKGEPHLKG